MLLVFAFLYSLVGILVIWVASNLKFGEVCSWYVAIPLIGVAFGDWVLERVNKYFAKTIREPLSKRINFDLYMGILNAFMYASVYVAGGLWVYRLNGNFFLLPFILFIGLLSGAYTIKKVYR
ncbi:MAG: hypothetical protein ABIL16_07775 [candidate division WOR-3 bacterium]